MTNDEIVKKIQKSEYIMLKNITDIFEKNGIKYYLACGTTLGAVRHNGFIPWDDDVDIYCLANDMKKIELILSDNNLDLEYQDGLITKDYPYWFPKIIDKKSVLIENSMRKNKYTCGLYIDVFPLMELPEDEKKVKKIERKRYFYYCLLRAYYNNNGSIFEKIINILSHFIINPKIVNKKLYNLYIKKYETKKYLVDTGTFNKQALINEEYFGEGKKVLFNENEFIVPSEVDKYLTHYYGNYMELPPEEKRVSNHDFYYLSIGNEVIIGENK